MCIRDRWCPPSVDESNRALQFDGVDDFVELPFIFDPMMILQLVFGLKEVIMEQMPVMLFYLRRMATLLVK